MQLTKFGHSCVLLDDGQTKILFDPGVWSEIPDMQVDAIVITHIHKDHFDIDKHANLYKSASKIITQSEVKTELDNYGLASELLEHGQSLKVGTMTLQGFGLDHASIAEDFPKFKNTGYLVNEKIFHPGDSFTVPGVDVELLLLPVSAPWSKVSETMTYLTKVNPKKSFAIHDAFLNSSGLEMYERLLNISGDKIGMQFIQPQIGKIYEI